VVTACAWVWRLTTATRADYDHFRARSALRRRRALPLVKYRHHAFPQTLFILLALTSVCCFLFSGLILLLSNAAPPSVRSITGWRIEYAGRMLAGQCWTRCAGYSVAANIAYERCTPYLLQRRHWTTGGRTETLLLTVASDTRNCAGASSVRL